MKKTIIGIIVTLLFLSLIVVPNNAFAAETNPIMSVELKNYLGSKTSIPIKATGTYQVSGDGAVILNSNQNYYVRNENGALKLFLDDNL